MTSGMGLDGDQELLARLARARDGITDLTGYNRDTAQLVDHKATADVPRHSGALADSASITVSRDGWGISYSKAYASPVHWGTRLMVARPWLLEAARSTEDSWMDGLQEHVQQLLD